MVVLSAQEPLPPEIHQREGGMQLPFGYYVERDPDLLIVRQPDYSFVAAFNAGVADPFEVEATVWEDAD